MHGLLERRWLDTASRSAAVWGRCPSTSHTRATMRLRPRPRLRAKARDRPMDRKLLSLRCDPEQCSALLWPLVTCNHSCIRPELACSTAPPQRCPLSHPWVRTTKALQAWLRSARKCSFATPVFWGLFALHLELLLLFFSRYFLCYNLSQSPSLSVGACQPCSAAHYKKRLQHRKNQKSVPFDQDLCSNTD